MYTFLQGGYFTTGPLVRMFAILLSRSPLSLEDFANCVGYHCSNHTAAGEVLVHSPRDLSCYCHFGVTLPTP